MPSGHGSALQHTPQPLQAAPAGGLGGASGCNQIVSGVIVAVTVHAAKPARFRQMRRLFGIGLVMEGERRGATVLADETLRSFPCVPLPPATGCKRLASPPTGQAGPRKVVEPIEACGNRGRKVSER